MSSNTPITPLANRLLYFIKMNIKINIKLAKNTHSMLVQNIFTSCISFSIPSCLLFVTVDRSNIKIKSKKKIYRI